MGGDGMVGGLREATCVDGPSGGEELLTSNVWTWSSGDQCTHGFGELVPQP